MKQVRELHGKTLQEVAPKVGISVSMLSLVEREKYAVSEGLLKKWLRLFYMEEAGLRDGVIAWSKFVPSPYGAGTVIR